MDEWINAKTELPEKDGLYWCIRKYDAYDTRKELCWFRNGAWFNYWGHPIPDGGISRWMWDEDDGK